MGREEPVTKLAVAVDAAPHGAAHGAASETEGRLPNDDTGKAEDSAASRAVCGN